MQSAQFQLHARIEERHWWFVARRQIVRRLVREVLPPSRATTIVDVGCGTGANLASLAGDYNCVGIDTSGEAVRLAAERFPQVRFLHGYAPQDLGEVVDEAKLVMMMDVLEHVPDDFALLSSMLAATQPGTYFLLTVPADMALWSQHDVSFGHYRRYTVERLRQAWAGLPVTPLVVSPYNARLYGMVKLIRALNQRRGEAAGIAGTDFRQPAGPLNALLTRTFAGESQRLVNLLHGRRQAPYRRGVSLLALLYREHGQFEVRTRPDWLAADPHDPAVAIS